MLQASIQRRQRFCDRSTSDPFQNISATSGVRISSPGCRRRCVNCWPAVTRRPLSASRANVAAHCPGQPTAKINPPPGIARLKYGKPLSVGLPAGRRERLARVRTERVLIGLVALRAAVVARECRAGRTRLLAADFMLNVERLNLLENRRLGRCPRSGNRPSTRPRGSRRTRPTRIALPDPSWDRSKSTCVGCVRHRVFLWLAFLRPLGQQIGGRFSVIDKCQRRIGLDEPLVDPPFSFLELRQVRRRSGPTDGCSKSAPECNRDQLTKRADAHGEVLH